MDNLNDALKEKSSLADKTEFFVFLPNDQIKPNDRANENKDFIDAIAAKNEGNLKFRNEQFDAAIKLYDEAIKRFDDMDQLHNLELAVCYQNRATAKMYLRDSNGCISDANKAIELNEHYSKAFYRRAAAYNDQRNYYRALQDIVQACILERFRNKTYTEMVCTLLSEIDKNPVELQWKMAYLETEADKLYCDHCIKNQLKFIKNCGILDLISVPVPNDQTPVVGYIKAMVGLNEMNLDKIMAGCKEEESMKGNYLAESFIVLAYMSDVAKASTSILHREFAKDLRRMNELIWDDKTTENIKFNALLCRANIYNRQGKYQDATAELKLLEKKHKNNPLVYIIKSGSLMQLARSKPEFMKALEKCCTLLPNVYELHLSQALAEISSPMNKIFRTTDPVKKMEELINRFPNEVDARVGLVVIYTKLGETQKAKQILKKAEKELPNRTIEMSSVYGMLHPTHPSCVAYFKRSLVFNKNDPGSLKGLLDYYSLTTYEYAKAIEVSTKALCSYLQHSDFQEMFEHRQKLLNKIVRQDYWHRL